MTTTNTNNTAGEPKFSVIIPCWNSSATLRETLESVASQTYLDWEALIVDDGSTDETASIILEYANRDRRFKLLASDHKGPSFARNLACLTHARGQYLAFLDSDDLWKPEKLKHTLSYFAANEKVDGVYAQIAFFRTSRLNPETYSNVYEGILAPIDFLRDNPVCTMSNLVIKTATFRRFNGFDESIIHNEDVEFLVRASARGVRIEGMNENLVSYRTSLTGLSSNIEKMRAGWFKAIEALQSTPARLTSQEIADADAGNLRYLARRALRTGAPGLEPLRLAVHGLSRSPLSFLNPPWRGGMTLLGAVASPLLPKSIRKLAFSR